jgi:phospholipid/cholesterol/gamma-HCH transport system ATP-binding protein
VADRVAMLHAKRFPYVGDVDSFRQIDDPIVRDFIEGKTVR